MARYDSTGGLRPAGPPIAVARGAPCPTPLRPGAPRARFINSPGGFAPPDPPSPSLADRGPRRACCARWGVAAPCPTPLRRGAPMARVVMIQPGGFAPPAPPSPSLAGPHAPLRSGARRADSALGPSPWPRGPMPHSAPAGRADGALMIQPGGFAPPAPHRRRSRGMPYSAPAGRADGALMKNNLFSERL